MRQQQDNADATQQPTGSVIVRLRLIGQMEAWTLASESILPTGRKTRALFAILALSAPRPVLRGRLAELLWSRRPDEQARASLRQEIHRLLEALDPVGSQVLAISRDHLAVRPGAVWVDVDEVLRTSVAQPAALGLLDGVLLEDLDGVDPAFDVWLAGERERLSDGARQLAETLLRDHSEADAIIPAAQQLLSIDRTHEGAWRALMRAFASRGERGLAIQAFERCRAVLADQLSAQPSVETQRLAAEIRAVPPQRAEAPAVSEGMIIATSVVDRRSAPRPPARQPAGRAADEDDHATVGSPRIDPRNEAQTESTDASRPPVRGGARVGVLPLQMSGTTDAEAHLSTGLADEITTALARFRWMFLVSSSSLAQFAVKSRDETAIRSAFGLDFLLDGSVQRGGERLRVSLRLLDLRAGNRVVWSRRFDRDAHDLLTLQDEVAAEVVAQIDPEILLIESQRVTARPPANPTAYDLMLRALPLMTRLERPVFMQAGELLRQATLLEPDYAASHACYAYWYLFLVSQGWAPDAQAGMAEAGRLAERAVSLDPQDAKALTIAAHVRSFLYRRHREAIALHERALSLNPNLAMAWNLSGLAFAYIGDLDEAARRITRSKQLSPLDPQAFFFDTGRVLVALLRQDLDEAEAIGREVTSMNPNYAAAFLPYLAALGHLDRQADAALALARLRVLRPDFSVTKFLATTPLERPEHRDYQAHGLRLAGVPE